MFITNQKSILNHKGMSLVEILVVLFITSILMTGVFYTLSTGKDAWLITDSQMQLQQSARQLLEKVSKELRESGFDKNGTIQVSIVNGGGAGNSDILRFSMPVMCEAGEAVIDANGDVAHWGAPLTWGCSTSSCMDADDDCATVDYKTIQYEKNVSNKFMRSVLNGLGNTVNGSQTELAQNISDFHAVLSVDQNLVTLTITVSKNTDSNRVITATMSMDVYLRNRG